MLNGPFLVHVGLSGSNLLSGDLFGRKIELFVNGFILHEHVKSLISQSSHLVARGVSNPLFLNQAIDVFGTGVPFS